MQRFLLITTLFLLSSCVSYNNAFNPLNESYNTEAPPNPKGREGSRIITMLLREYCLRLYLTCGVQCLDEYCNVIISNAIRNTSSITKTEILPLSLDNIEHGRPLKRNSNDGNMY